MRFNAASLCALLQPPCSALRMNLSVTSWRVSAVAPPNDEMRGIRRIDHVDSVNVGRIFLADALKHALGTGAFASTRVENALPASKPTDPLSTARRETSGFFIGVSIRLVFPLILA